MGLSGNISGTKLFRGYTKGLIERFGEEEGQEIIDYCESQSETVKFTWQELEANRAKYSAEIRRLEKVLAASVGGI